MPSAWKKGKIRHLLPASNHHRPKDKRGGDDDDAGPRGPKKPPRWLLPPAAGVPGFSTMASLASQVIAASSWSPPPPPDMAAEDAQLQQQQEGGDDDLESFIEADMLATNVPYGLAPSSNLPKEEVALGQKAPKRGVHQSFLISERDASKGLEEPEARKSEAFESLSGSGTMKDRTLQPKATVSGAPGSSPVAAEEAEKKALEAEKNRGFMVVAKALLFLAILVMGIKKITVGISIAALAAVLLEAAGRRLRPSRQPRKEEGNSVEALEGDALLSASNLAPEPDGLDSSSCQGIPFELVGNRDVDSDSEGASELRVSMEEGSHCEDATEPAPEESNSVEAEGGQVDQRPRRKKGGKTTRLLRKFVTKGPTTSSLGKER